MGSSKRSIAVYVGGFLLAMHYASIAYINSSLLKQYVGDTSLNILYVIGSLFSLTFLSLAPFFLRKYGNAPTLLCFIFLEILAIFGLGSLNISALIIAFFLVQLAVEPVLYFCLDINLEQSTKTENTTGNKRGIFLTIQNLAWVASPLILSFLVAQNNFSRAYFLSVAALIPLFIIVALFFRKTVATDRTVSNIWAGLRVLRKGDDRVRIMGVQFVLNFFYSWMMIYLPLLLTQEIGFGWGTVGVIFTIMLLPFLLFELPAGILSDKKIGEKELLTVGFIIMSLATLVIPMLQTISLFIWAAVLFITRVGAALIEISSETYFFKQVKEEDTGLISLFRMARPLSFIVAPLIALPIVYFFSYAVSFYFLAGFVLLGLLFIPKVDTK